ncbi:MAG: 7-cyano-7-deazaguanine synthase, partial [Planctomycetes bacterium]|nr:7-cyano-7-deazaguanine synthase [Planctomycetota bacterium]
MSTVASVSYEHKVAALHAQLAALPGAVVAFSGGVDSTALLHACRHALGERVVAVTADSPSLPRAELAEAAALAERLAVRHVVLTTHELEQPAYRANAGDRCYHCKKELFVTVAQRRAEIAPADWPVVYGVIVDDLGDHRPGQKAAAEHGVVGPLVDAGMTKDDVRRYSRAAD